MSDCILSIRWNAAESSIDAKAVAPAMERKYLMSWLAGVSRETFYDWKDDRDNRRTYHQLNMAHILFSKQFAREDRVLWQRESHTKWDSD